MSRARRLDERSGLGGPGFLAGVEKLVSPEHVAKKKDGYTFIEAGGRSVSLPGKPQMALRIRRVSGALGEISDKPPGN